MVFESATGYGEKKKREIRIERKEGDTVKGKHMAGTEEYITERATVSRNGCEIGFLLLSLSYGQSPHWWESASKMFVNCNVPTFQALLRNVMFKCMCRLTESRNGVGIV